MHGYVAAEEPGELPTLITFPAAVAAIGRPAPGTAAWPTSTPITPGTWTRGTTAGTVPALVAAARVHDSAGAGAGRRLSDAFVYADGSRR